MSGGIVWDIEALCVLLGLLLVAVVALRVRVLVLRHRRQGRLPARATELMVRSGQLSMASRPRRRYPRRHD